MVKGFLLHLAKDVALETKSVIKELINRPSGAKGPRKF